MSEQRRSVGPLAIRVAGAVEVVLAISFAALVFGGHLSDFLAEGIGIYLIAAAITLLTGITFSSLGHFRLGSLARFVPYPVVGGFLAGTGWLLAKGALDALLD